MKTRHSAEIGTASVIVVVLLLALALSFGRHGDDGVVFPQSQGITAGADGRTAARADVPTTTVPSAPVLPTGSAQAIKSEAQLLAAIDSARSPARPPVVVVAPIAVAGRSPTPGPSGVQAYQNGPEPPTAHIIDVSPEQPGINEEVTLRFRGGDPDGFVRGWLIDWGDGQYSGDAYDERCGPVPGEPDHEFPAVHHSYREIGKYTIQVLVVSKGTCGQGPTQRATDEVRITVAAAIPQI